VTVVLSLLSIWVDAAWVDGEAVGLGKVRSGNEGTPLRAGVDSLGTVGSFRDTAAPVLESLTALGPATLTHRVSIMALWTN
jgi:hypothetical protein